VFDNTISPWLNRANKNRVISDFETNLSKVYFKIEETSIGEFIEIIPTEFEYSFEY
jgi:hypothetical protein